MSIRVVNLRSYRPVENEILIKVDRSSVLGNKFRMRDMSDNERNRVCDEYEKWFNRKVKEKGDFRNEVIKIYRMVRGGKDVALGCWCSPKRCHADYIKKFIESYLEGPKGSSNSFRVEFEFEDEEQTWKYAFLDNNGEGFTFEDATTVARQLSQDNICYKRNIRVVKASK